MCTSDAVIHRWLHVLNCALTLLIVAGEDRIVYI